MIAVYILAGIGGVVVVLIALAVIAVLIARQRINEVVKGLDDIGWPDGPDPVAVAEEFAGSPSVPLLSPITPKTLDLAGSIGEFQRLYDEYKVNGRLPGVDQ